MIHPHRRRSPQKTELMTSESKILAMLPNDVTVLKKLFVKQSKEKQELQKKLNENGQQAAEQIIVQLNSEIQLKDQQLIDYKKQLNQMITLQNESISRIQELESMNNEFVIQLTEGESQQIKRIYSELFDETLGDECHDDPLLLIIAEINQLKQGRRELQQVQRQMEEQQRLQEDLVEHIVKTQGSQETQDTEKDVVQFLRSQLDAAEEKIVHLNEELRGKDAEIKYLQDQNIVLKGQIAMQHDDDAEQQMNRRIIEELSEQLKNCRAELARQPPSSPVANTGPSDQGKAVSVIQLQKTPQRGEMAGSFGAEINKISRDLDNIFKIIEQPHTANSPTNGSDQQQQQQTSPIQKASPIVDVERAQLNVVPTAQPQNKTDCSSRRKRLQARTERLLQLIDMK